MFVAAGFGGGVGVRGLGGGGGGEARTGSAGDECRLDGVRLRVEVDLRRGVGERERERPLDCLVLP